MLKPTLLIVLILLFCIPVSNNISAQEEVQDIQKDSVDISAESALLLDWESKRALYAKEPHKERPIASITKIMTAILAIEHGDLDEEVKTSPTAAHTGGSSIWLEENEIKTLDELLLGLILRSGNDAAVAIAEHISGSVEDFAKLMTKRARELGALNTSFKNPHGLHHPEHYSTAYDMALIAAHAMTLEEFQRIASTSSTIISWPEHPWDRHLYNQNKLLRIYEGAEGVKTGWTTPAGRCFVGSASRGGQRLISVVLNAPEMWDDTTALLDYGFNNYASFELIKAQQYLKSIPVTEGVTGKVEAYAAENFDFPLAKAEERKISYYFNVEQPLEAPLYKGERIGELELYLNNELIGFVNLVAGNDVEKLTWWRRLIQLWGRGS